MPPEPRLNKLGDRRGYALVDLYGEDFIAARARSGHMKAALAAVRHPERLSPEEVEAVYHQHMRRHSALMTEARRAKKRARLAAEATAQEEAAS